MATLYHYPLCPFSRKIRLLLRERNIDPDLITETFWQKRKEFIKTNPSGEVPVLIINNHKVCGILQETCFYNDNKFLIIGIGVNVVKSPIINIK